MDITPHTSPRKPAYPILLATVAAGALLAQATAQGAQVIKGGKRRVSPPEQVETKAAPAAVSREVTPPKQADPRNQPPRRQERQPIMGRARIREPKAPQNP